MKFPCIRPYKTFLVDDDGKRTRLDAHEIVLERPIGVDLEISLAPKTSAPVVDLASRRTRA